jgi:hypothetical protein
VAVWFYRSGATGAGNGLSWTDARVSLATMTSVVAGEQIWVSEDHNEAPGAALTITFPGTSTNPNLVICADHNVASPTSTDWKTTGVVSTTGTFNLAVNGSAYIYGLTFTAGLTSNAIVGLAVGGGTGSYQYYDSCVLRLATTSASGSSRLSIGTTGNGVGNRIILDNTQVNFAHIAQNITLAQGSCVWRNTANPFPGQVPTTMMSTFTQPFTWTFEAVDFLLMDAGKTFFAAGTTYYRAAFYGCRIGGSGTITATPLASSGSEIILCHAGVPNNPATVSRMTRYTFDGLEQTDITIARVGGSNDSTRAFSRTYIPNINTLALRPYTGLPLAKWNATVDANITITLYAIKNIGGGVPYNNQMWFEVQYYGDASLTSLATIDHCGVKPNFADTASITQWTADTSDWTASPLVTARANSQSYAANTPIKVASNPGRVFFCTTGGTTAASEPAAYATAVDADNFADGTAFFRAGTRWKMSMTISSPQVKAPGPIYVVPKIAGMIGTVPFLWLDAVIG